MAGKHGVQIKKFLSEDKKKMFKKKYSSLSSANGFIDFGHVLANDQTLSYIDGVHYSPSSNKKIAQELYKYIN